MVKQQPRMGKRRTASASAASGKGRPQRSVNPVPPASHRQWRAGLRSPCAAAHAEDSCATPYWVFSGSPTPGRPVLVWFLGHRLLGTAGE